MSGKTITRADLAEAVFRKVGLSRTESAELVEMVIDEVCSAIVRGDSVKLSSFATFQVRDKKERIGRNPKTGEEVPISPRRVMTFKASNVLKNRVPEGASGPKGQSQALSSHGPRLGGSGKGKKVRFRPGYRSHLIFPTQTFEMTHP
jgi:integration host factor subunit alpha